MIQKSPVYFIGIDEVGRGPIAGPVAVGAFLVAMPKVNLPEIIIPENSTGVSVAQLMRTYIGRTFPGIKESKQLSEKKREEWFAKIEAAVLQQYSGSYPGFYFDVTFLNEKSIDKKGISHCIQYCIDLAVANLIKKIIISNGYFDPDEFCILLDGGLKAPAHFKNQQTIIRGDAKEPLIALASICAKVLRDRKMRQFSEKYPLYLFDAHKGYGTKAHYKAIQKHGLSPIHRLSFCKSVLNPVS